MRNYFIKLISLIVALSIVCAAFSSCGKKQKFSNDSLTAMKNTLKHTYSFDQGNTSETAQFDSDKINKFIVGIKNTAVDYGYAEMFDYEKAMSGIDIDHTVDKHLFSALDSSGALTKEHLLEVVNRNTKEYLNDSTMGVISAIDDQSFLLRICEIITDVTNDILKQYPDIDKERVYCNLGNLKVIEKKSALDYAAVEPGMILHINQATAQLADLLAGKSMYSVIIHETMHIIQYGCSCEPSTECTRRCGLAHAYDWEQDYSDWLWFVEGSAERMTCLYSDVEPMTYGNMVRYIVTMDLATMLQKNVPVNYAETINFYCDPQMLFDLFGCETEQDKEEIYHLIYGLEMMHTQSEDVKEVYKERYGAELVDAVAADFNNTIKRPIVKTITKNFYRNLAQTVATETVTKNDLLFLLNIFDSTINCHLCFDRPKQDDYNAAFAEWYQQTQNAFFDCFPNVSMDDYTDYAAVKDDTLLNAGMQWLASDKQAFLADKYEALDNNFKYVGK